MIEVLYGPANSGKSETLVARVAEAIAAGSRAAHLVVPSLHVAGALLDRLSEKVGLPSFQPLTTFPALYKKILQNGNCTRPELRLIERDRLLRHIITELASAGRLAYFGETAQLPGVVNALAEFIDELQRSGASPAEFARLAEARSDKDRDIAEVFAGYTEALDSLGVVDTESAGPAALTVLMGSAEPHRWLSLVAVDGFDYLTSVQVHLLSALAAPGIAVVVNLTYDEAGALHYWQRPTVARLRAAGAIFTRCESKPQSLIQEAANALMDDRRATEAAGVKVIDEASSRGEITIVSAPDRAGEARAVAREIKRLADEQRIAPDQIAIVCRQLSLYAHHLERIFSEWAIPLCIDLPLVVAENPAVVALRELLNLAGQFFPRRACLNLWRSPYFDWSEFGLDETAINLLDELSLAAHVTRGRDQWLQAVDDLAEKKGRERVGVEHGFSEEEDATERLARCKQLRTNLEGWFDAVTPFAKASRQAHFAWASALIARLQVETCAANGDHAQRDARALEEFNKVFAALAQDDLVSRRLRSPDDASAEMIAWHEFMFELDRMLAVITCERETITGPAVVAQEAHRLRQQRYRAVFVLGLIEGEFPARLTDRAPYTLAERDALRRAGLDLTETITEPGADVLQFYKAMCRATERLYLSYARTDVAGGELLSSYLIEEVQPFATTSLQRIAPDDFGERSDASAACSLEELAMRTARAQRQAQLARGARPSSATETDIQLLRAQLPSWRLSERGAQVEWQRLRSEEHDRYSGWMNDTSLRTALKERFGPEHLWSASQINDYGICPFRFFARHALKLDPHVEPEEGFASHHLGHAYHRILERLYTELHRHQTMIESSTVEAATDEAARIAELVLTEMLDNGEVRRDAVWEFSKDEIKRRVARLLRREAAWNDEEPAQPVHCECKFGLDGKAPLIISCPDGDIRFCGIVDRIDHRRENNEWVVVDYKTRRTPIPIKDAVEGRNLQLPIYAMAATRVIKKGERVASAYYLHIHSRKRGSQLTKKADSTASLDAMIELAEARIREYVVRVRNGHFPIEPNGDTVCQTCDYGVMCRVRSLRAIQDEQERND
jgi:ATP-dependent helicase/nuclease subunit B